MITDAEIGELEAILGETEADAAAKVDEYVARIADLAGVEKAEAELEEYKRSVTEHFGQTAAHFQAIGKQYRELYEHMANGAQVLCESDEAGKQLLFAPGADAPSASVEDPSAEAVADEEVRSPIDYAEQPSAKDAADAPEAEEGTVSETTAEPQPEGKAEAGERTLH